MAPDPRLMERLLVECLQRIDSGEPFVFPKEAEANPEIAEELRQYFSMAMLVERAAVHLETRVYSEDGTLHFAPLPQLEGFEILGELGRGGMGIVYRAYQERAQRQVALKVLPPALAAHPVLLARFKKEAAAAASLTASHVLPIYDVIEDHSVPILVMPLVDGLSLDRILAQRERGPGSDEQHPWVALPDEQYLFAVLGAADQTVEAVTAIHRAGILHRDIKPSNILVDRDGNVWLSDFGLARVSTDHSLTAPGDVLGTPGYMSPEQIAGLEDIDARTDIFSLGVTIFRVLTRELPYGTELIRESTPLPCEPSSRQPRLSRDHDAVILKALHPERSQRYQSMVEFQEDWRRVRSGLLPKARRVTRLHRLTRWLKTNRVATAAVVIAAVALMFSGLVLALLTGEPTHLQTVLLETEPIGARVAFVPLDARTGEPIPEQIVDAGTSPVRQELAPGDYLVVACLEDDSGRFHEVFRHVPDGEEKLAPDRVYYYRHTFWRLQADGAVELRSVQIPPATVTTGMAFLEGKKNVPTAPGTPRADVLVTEIPGFYIDTHETTVGDWRTIPGGMMMPVEYLKKLNLSDEDALVVAYDHAVNVAERLGKRLPSIIELRYAATARATTAFPWGDTPPEQMGEPPSEIGPVGDVAFDKLPTDPPVYGLCSNVAEITTTWGRDPFMHDVAAYPEISTTRDYRLVCGGCDETIKGDGGVSAECRSPARPRPLRVHRTEWRRGLGFRCVRSAKPRLKPEDFARPPFAENHSARIRR